VIDRKRAPERKVFPIITFERPGGLSGPEASRFQPGFMVGLNFNF
jgi:hypothetical protein